MRPINNKMLTIFNEYIKFNIPDKNESLYYDLNIYANACKNHKRSNFNKCPNQLKSKKRFLNRTEMELRVMLLPS